MEAIYEDEMLPPTTEELLGENLDWLSCEEKTFELRGLKINSFKYISKIVGATRHPIFAVHGGPGFTHSYIKPLFLLCSSGYPVIFYDQAGCGKSTFIEDPAIEAPWLLTISYYLEELNSLISLYAAEKYYLYGSSWGTIVVQEFAIKQPTGLLGIILDSPLCDPELYISTQFNKRISTLPSFTQRLLQKLNDEKKFDLPLYKLLDKEISKHFVCRTIPLPQLWYDSIDGMNDQIYRLMQGESEFTIGGILKDWNCTNKLYLIQVPCFVIIGEYDTMTIECASKIIENIPLAQKLCIIERASHCKLLEEPKAVTTEIYCFLETIPNK